MIEVGVTVISAILKPRSSFDATTQLAGILVQGAFGASGTDYSCV